MKTRKSHHKSRFGCLPCKKRRTKCGEESPSCQNCINRHIECAYRLPPTSGTGAGSHTSSTGDANPTSFKYKRRAQLPLTCLCGQDPTKQSSVGTTRLQELQLMHHYITVACETLTHGPQDIDVWRSAVPKEAVEHEFLMDGLLALSSLHLAVENPDSRWKYTEIAIQYQNSGLRGYTKALERITISNSHALFAYSVIITILALAFPSVCQESPYFSHTESLVSMFELLQGVRIINQASKDSLRNGKFKGLFRPIPLEIEQPVPGDEVMSALHELHERANNIAKDTGPDRHQVYSTSIKTLELAFGSVESSKFLGSVIAWPVLVSEKLLVLFKHGDPMTQLIFIHYGVLLLQSHDRWWGRDFGLRLIKSLTESVCAVDPELASWTEWASRTAALATQGVCQTWTRNGQFLKDESQKSPIQYSETKAQSPNSLHKRPFQGA